MKQALLDYHLCCDLPFLYDYELFWVLCDVSCEELGKYNHPFDTVYSVQL